MKTPKARRLVREYDTVAARVQHLSREYDSASRLLDQGQAQMNAAKTTLDGAMARLKKATSRLEEARIEMEAASSAVTVAEEGLEVLVAEEQLLAHRLQKASATFVGLEAGRAEALKRLNEVAQKAAEFEKWKEKTSANFDIRSLAKGRWVGRVQIGESFLWDKGGSAACVKERLLAQIRGKRRVKVLSLVEEKLW